MSGALPFDPWTAHSENVALAERIAEVCPGLEADKAYVCGHVA